MDFVHRMTSNQPQGQRAAAPEQFGLPKAPRDNHRSPLDADRLSVISRIGTNVLLLAVALLIATLAWLTYESKPASQGRLVDSNKLQAVFLNTGQVYFGNINSLNREFAVLSNVYYLQSQQSTATNSKSAASPSLSLIKLGCELHQPYDQMVINTSQITFWENLKDGGQVAKAVAQFQQQNPNGQKCSDTPPASSTSNNLQNPANSKNQ